MDHETAVQLQAAERYVLDEFSPKERADFEEHFFAAPGARTRSGPQPSWLPTPKLY